MFGKHTNDFTLKWPCQFMEMHSKPKSRVAHIMNWLSTHFNTMYPVDSSFEFPCFFPLHTWLVRTILDLLPLTWLKWVLVINIFGALVKHGKFLRKKNTKCTMQFHFHHCSNENSAQEQDENSIHKSTMNLLSNVIHGRDSLFAVRKCKTCFQLSKKRRIQRFCANWTVERKHRGCGCCVRACPFRRSGWKNYDNLWKFNSLDSISCHGGM